MPLRRWTQRRPLLRARDRRRAIKSITEISGLKMEQDVIELKENGPDGKYVIKKLPGRWKAPEVTLTRGLTEDNSFDKWIKDSQFGKMGDVRKGGAIIVYDYEGKAVKRYKLTTPGPRASRSARSRPVTPPCSPRSSSSPGAPRGRVMRGRPCDALANEHAAAPDGRRSADPSPPRNAGDRVPVRAPAWLRRSAGTVHRDGVMRLATARDELVPLRDTGCARTRRTSRWCCSAASSPGSGRSPTSTPGRWRTCSPPTWPSSRTSTAGSTRRATPAPASPARPAATSSRSTWPVGAWGNRDVPGRHALRGGRVRRLPLPLVARRSSTSSTPSAGSTSRASRGSTRPASGGDRHAVAVGLARSGADLPSDRTRLAPPGPAPRDAWRRSPHSSGPRTRLSPRVTSTRSGPPSPPNRTRGSNLGTPSSRPPRPVESRAWRSPQAASHEFALPAEKKKKGGGRGPAPGTVRAAQLCLAP